MASMECPKCGRTLDMTGHAPGASLTCPCGNVMAVTAPSNIGLSALLVIAALVIFGVTVAVPKYRQYRAFNQRAWQAECKSNLKGWFTAQKSYYFENGVYEPVMAKVGFMPEPGNRYAYFVGEVPMELRDEGSALPVEGARAIGMDTRKHEARPIAFSDLPASVAGRLGVSGTCPQCNITAACATNLDDDGTLDVWVISTGDMEDLRDEEGYPTPAGLPVNVVYDVKQ